MAKKQGAVWLIAVGVVALAYLQSQGMLFQTSGAFTLATFELDDYGEVWFSQSPLSLAVINGVWQDDQGHFYISAFGRPYVAAESENEHNPLVIPEIYKLGTNILVEESDTTRVTINEDIVGNDVKVVFELDALRSVAARGGPTEVVTEIPGCTSRRGLGAGLHVIEWRSSVLQAGYGAMFVDGIRECETVAQNGSVIKLSVFASQANSGSIVEQQTPMVKIWAVGKRLPFNCKIDTLHEALFLEQFPAGSVLSIDSLTFEPIAFCRESPVVMVSSEMQGISSSTEPFLKWAVGDSVTVPEHEVWSVSYVADWKKAGLSSGCGPNDRYLVGDKKCESEARIVVATRVDDEVQVTQTTESGTLPSETVSIKAAEQEAVSLDVKQGGSNALLIGIVAAVVLFFLAFKPWKRGK